MRNLSGGAQAARRKLLSSRDYLPVVGGIEIHSQIDDNNVQNLR
jgi:hypothetical protein